MDNYNSEGFLVLLYLLGVMAVFRVSEMVHVDVGPLDIFDKMRMLAYKVPVLCELIQCYYCISVWGALLYTVWVWSSIELPLWLAPIFWMSVAGGASAIYRIVSDR